MITYIINNLTELKGLMILIFFGISARVVNPTMGGGTATAPIQKLLWAVGIFVGVITIFKFFQNQWDKKTAGKSSIFNLFKT